MDQDLLIPFLEERFREISQQIAAGRQETAERFEQIDQRFERVDQRSERFEQRFEQMDRRAEQADRRAEQMDHRFEQMEQRFERRFEQMDRRADRAEETARHTLVLLEDLRHQVQLIAEGHVGLNERLDRIESRGTLTFEQVKGWIDPYFRHVDSRLRIFEGWADRQNLTIVNAIRALLGKLPLEPPPAVV
jgi:predicted RNase H-like nuclease (RuvC/YqgF family)